MSGQDGMAQPAPARAQNPMENYRFSPEEMKALRECNSESFFQRSLPIGTALGVGAFYGVKAGYLAGNARWGAVPKVVLACTLGYFLGKFSYQRRCAEKLMQLPDSRIGQMLRQRRNAGTFQDSIDPGGIGSMTMAPFGAFPQDSYTDVQPGMRGSLDIDAYRPIAQGLDDATPPFEPAPSDEHDAASEPASKYASYDDLRRKNRDEYANTKAALFRPSSEQLPVAPRSPPPPRPDDAAAPRGERNQYGDVWE